MRQIAAYLGVTLVRRGVLLAMFMAALLGACESWFWAPARERHQMLKAEVVSLQSRRATLQARVDAIGSHDEMAAQMDVLQTRLAAPVDRSSVVERLSGISARAGTRIIHGANSFGRPRGAVRPVMQDLTIEGSYTQVVAFLNELPELETLTLLRSAEFSANPDGTLVRVQMKLMTLSGRTEG